MKKSVKRTSVSLDVDIKKEICKYADSIVNDLKEDLNDNITYLKGNKLTLPLLTLISRINKYQHRYMYAKNVKLKNLSDISEILVNHGYKDFDKFEVYDLVFLPYLTEQIENTVSLNLYMVCSDFSSRW